jgi:hypothetical protein
MIVDRFGKEIKERIIKNRYYTDLRFKLENNAHYKTIRMCNIAVIKIIELKTVTRMEIAKRFLEHFHLQGEASFKKADPLWAKIPFNEVVCKKILEGAETVFEECYKEGQIYIFGCCSRYLECSDQRKCIHPDIKFARGCMYKLNLEKGQIFFGQNRNIDRQVMERKKDDFRGQQIRLW